jgi:hypothetical protein
MMQLLGEHYNLLGLKTSHGICPCGCFLLPGTC